MTDQRFAYAMMLAAPGMFATNMLVARATADWFPPVALAFWRWAATAALMAALLAPTALLMLARRLSPPRASAFAMVAGASLLIAGFGTAAL